MRLSVITPRDGGEAKTATRLEICCLIWVTRCSETFGTTSIRWSWGATWSTFLGRSRPIELLQGRLTRHPPSTGAHCPTTGDQPRIGGCGCCETRTGPHYPGQCTDGQRAWCSQWRRSWAHARGAPQARTRCSRRAPLRQPARRRQARRVAQVRCSRCRLSPQQAPSAFRRSRLHPRRLPQRPAQRPAPRRRPPRIALRPRRLLSGSPGRSPTQRLLRPPLTRQRLLRLHRRFGATSLPTTTPLENRGPKIGSP